MRVFKGGGAIDPLPGRADRENSRPCRSLRSRPAGSDVRTASGGIRPAAHAWLLNRREAAARLGVSPGSNNFGGEPWDNPVYLRDPAEFDRLSRDPCNAPLNWRRDLGCPGENLFTKAEVRDGSLQSGGGIAPPVRRSRGTVIPHSTTGNRTALAEPPGGDFPAAIGACQPLGLVAH